MLCYAGSSRGILPLRLGVLVSLDSVIVMKFDTKLFPPTALEKSMPPGLRCCAAGQPCCASAMSVFTVGEFTTSLSASLMIKRSKVYQS